MLAWMLRGKRALKVKLSIPIGGLVFCHVQELEIYAMQLICLLSDSCLVVAGGAL